MEPLVISEGSPRRAPLADLALELGKKSAGLCRSLPKPMLSSLADLVRSMNCYYSNLIEGHDTHPIDIERALKNDYSNDATKRDLQLEAKAHITVQKWIDNGGLKGHAVSIDGVREIHRRFYEEVPEHLKWVEDPKKRKRLPVVPGAFREADVQVGRHIAISPGAISRFLNRFAEVYERLGPAEMVLATAAAHHRLAWIHPFIDGNGRVARLMSHAISLETLDTCSVWSVARGLARTVDRYKTLLANCDLPRRNDLDGRGTLSEEALVEFTEYFLRTSLDQVSFMESLVQPDKLRSRILLWVEEQIRLGELPPRSGIILEALLYRGKLPRGEVRNLLNVGERQASRVISALLERGVVRSASIRAPLQLVFPAELAARWMPGLFPEKT
ncbi:MAG: Fic family protein [Alphaproteobacteria bacterium]|nr:Fic family protein [Alphaproteobacteria bacterium]MDE2495015.1 Fic family protein [Alphaproteobacteria bacterium]